MPLWEAAVRARIEREAVFHGSQLREIGGVATAYSVTDKGYRLSPSGADYSLPVPLISDHNKDCPIGWVTEFRLVKGALRFNALLPNKGLNANIVWNGLLAASSRSIAVSVLSQEHPGCRKVEEDRIQTVTKWTLLELSVLSSGRGSNWDARIDYMAEGDQVLLDGR